MDEEDNYNTLLDELSSFEFQTQTSTLPREHTSLKEDDVNQYVLDKAKALVETGVTAVQDIASYATQTQNPDEVAALAELMQATTKAIEALNKSNLIDRKAKKDERIKIMELEARKEIAQLQPKNQAPTSMNVLVASREEIFKKLFEKPAIEAEVLEIDDK